MNALLAACEAVVSKYAEKPSQRPELRGTERQKTLSREDLRLICFDFLS